MTQPSQENTPSFAQAIQNAIAKGFARAHFGLVCKVERYDKDLQQVDVQPLVQQPKVNEEGETEYVTVPVIPNVPVGFPSAGGYRITLPIQRGDTCLVLFHDFSLDTWLAVGGIVSPDDPRRNDMSDGIALFGVRSFNDPIPNVPPEGMSIGKDDGPQVNITGSEIRAGEGAEEPLAKNADLVTILNLLQSWTVAPNDGGAALKTAANTLATPTGTSVLKGE